MMMIMMMMMSTTIQSRRRKRHIFPLGDLQGALDKKNIKARHFCAVELNLNRAIIETNVERNQEFAGKVCYTFSKSYHGINPEESIKKLENKHFTALYKDFNKFLSSESYTDGVRELFNTNSPCSGQYRAALALVRAIRSQIIRQHSEPVVKMSKERAEHFSGSVAQCSGPGRGKGR